MKDLYGAEYPAAATSFGIRMPLVSERRFMRSYKNADEKYSADVSRFADGSATISLAELTSDWALWPERDQHDFCWGCGSLHKHPEFPAMLRFIMDVGDDGQKAGIVGLVAKKLPMEEAFSILEKSLADTPYYTSNLIQAIAITKHPKAVALIHEHLASIWSRDDIWEDDSFLNWTATDALNCIEHLLELGESPTGFDAKVRALSEHICAGNRDSCSRNLGKYYEWLPAPKPWRFEGMAP
jgi:hypothetical protein